MPLSSFRHIKKYLIVIPQGSANPAIYWAPEKGCRLVRWQTAYSALVEGDHHLCVSSITRAADFTPASPFLVALLPYTSWIFV